MAAAQSARRDLAPVTPDSLDAVRAAYTELRKLAFAACDAQRWDDCLRGLNAARALDPAGEQDARNRPAEHALAKQERAAVRSEA